MAYETLNAKQLSSRISALANRCEISYHDNTPTASMVYTYPNIYYIQYYQFVWI